MTKPRKTTIRSSASKPAKGVHMNSVRIGMLVDVGEHGVIDLKSLHRRHFAHASAERCRQVAVQLARGGFLDPIALEVSFADREESQGGRLPTVYSLTPAGAEIVEKCTGVYPNRVMKRRPSAITIHHRLNVVKARMAIDEAAAACGLPAPFWVHEGDLRPGAVVDAMPNERRWLHYECRTSSGIVTCRPDAAVMLQIPRMNNAGFSHVGGLVEIDLATEGGNQCRAKVSGYAALLASKNFPYWREFANPSVRVFWIVRSERRLKALLQVFQNTAIADLCRFTTFGECGPGMLTQDVWQDVYGNRMSIYRCPE